MSDSDRLNQNLGKQQSDASKVLTDLQNKKTGKLPAGTSGFSGIANSTRTLFRSILGNSAASRSSSNTGLANILSSKPGNSNLTSTHGLNSSEGSSHWAESTGNTSQPESLVGDSLPYHNFSSTRQKPFTGPSLEDDLNNFTSAIDTSTEEKGSHFENFPEYTLELPFTPEYKSTPSLNERSFEARFPINNRFSLKSAPQVGLCIDNTEPLLITPDKSSTFSAEKRAYAWADEFLSHFSESLTENQTTESNRNPFEASNLKLGDELNNSSSTSEYSSNIISTKLPSKQSTSIFDDNPLKIGELDSLTDERGSSAQFAFETSIQSPKYLEQNELSHSVIDPGEHGLIGINSGWDNNWSPEQTDGADIVAFLNHASFPEELVPSISDLSVVEQAPEHMTHDANINLKWSSEFSQEEAELNNPKSLTELENHQETDPLAWSAEYEDQYLAKLNMPLFETSEVNDGADVVAFLNSNEFPEELASQFDDVSNLESTWQESVAAQNDGLDWAVEFNHDKSDNAAPTAEIPGKADLQSTFNHVFEAAQARTNAAEEIDLRNINSEELFIDTWDAADGEDVVAFLNSEHFPDSLRPSKDALVTNDNPILHTETKDIAASWSSEFNYTLMDSTESDGDDVVAFLNSSNFPKELLNTTDDISTMEELWSHTQKEDWSSEFIEAESMIDGAIHDKLVDSSLSVEQWLKEFENKETISELPKAAFGSEHSENVNTYFGSGITSHFNQKDAPAIVDGAEVVEFLSAGAFPFELTPDISDLDEVSELEMKAAENWFDEFQQFDSHSHKETRTVVKDNDVFAETSEDEIDEEWSLHFLRQPYLQDDVYSELSESRPPTPPDGFEVVAFLNHSNFPVELTTKTSEFSTYDSVKVYSVEQDQLNQSHLQRWLEEFEDTQSSAKENPIAGWVSEFSEIQDLIRQEFEYTEEVNGEEVDFHMFEQKPLAYSPRSYEFSTYHMNNHLKGDLDSFDSWTKDFLEAESIIHYPTENKFKEPTFTEQNIERSSSAENLSNYTHMLDKKESIESTIKDLIKEIANEITAEEFLYDFSQQEPFVDMPDTTRISAQTATLDRIKLEPLERTSAHSEVIKKNALGRLQQLRKHILGH